MLPMCMARPLIMTCSSLALAGNCANNARVKKNRAVFTQISVLDWTNPVIDAGGEILKSYFGLEIWSATRYIMAGLSFDILLQPWQLRGDSQA